MEILTLIKANIKKRKMNYIGVFILIFIISVFLTSIITIGVNSKSAISKQIENIGYGDWVSWLSGGDVDELERELGAIRDVSSVESIPCIYPSKGVFAGKETEKVLFLQSYDPSEYPFHVLNEDGVTVNINPGKLKEKEIYVPVSYKSLCDAEIGDKVQLTVDDCIHEYVIKGFFEDPFIGSAMMGIKTILMNNDEFNHLSDTGSEASGYVMNIHQSEDSDLSYMEFQSALNKETDLASYSYASLGKPQSFAYMTIIINIFSGVIVAFVIILLIVTLIVLSHSIGSSIELDYTNMGILKAVGFTKEMLRRAQIIQYAIAVLAGIFAGIPFAALVTDFVNRMTITITGVIIPSQIAIMPCILALIAVMLFIVGFIFLKTIKIGSISPLLAIRGGRKDVYFASRLKLPIFKCGIKFWLAMRQLVSNLKQHISAMVVTAILIFFLTLISKIGSWVGPTGEGVLAIFVPAPSDISINYIDDSAQKEAEKFIETYSDITNQFGSYYEYVLLNDMDCQCVYLSDAELYSIISGRTCRYENEVLITQFIADDLDLGIGDYISVSNGEYTKDFIISGIYQCAMDTGTNFAMSFEGYKYLTGKPMDGNVEYCLEDSSQKDNIVEKLNEEFSGKLEAGANAFDTVDAVVAAVNAFSLLMYVIAIIFVLIVIILMCDKIFAKEKHDIGIYKAIGFTTAQLRLQFAARFTVMALAGGILGIILSVFLTNPCMEVLLSLTGITEFEAEFTFISMIAPVIYVAVLFFVFGYLAARKIKRVEIKDLIVE